MFFKMFFLYVCLRGFLEVLRASVRWQARELGPPEVPKAAVAPELLRGVESEFE